MNDALQLTIPRDGGRGTRELQVAFATDAAKHFFALSPSLFSQPMRPLVGRLVTQLRQLGRGPVLDLFRRPQVHTFLFCALAGLHRGDRAWASKQLDALARQLVFELSLQGGPAHVLTWPLGEDDLPVTLASPTDLASCELTGSPVTCLRGSIRQGPAANQAIEVTRPSPLFHRLHGKLVLSLFDANPISDFEAHPDKEGNQLSLGDADASRWTASIDEALGVIERHMPDLFDEIRRVIHQIIPVGTDDEKHLSASYQESVGTIYMTLHPNLMTMTEAVIHEFQHNKVNMLFHLDPVMHNAFHPLFTSPVRPDPRPLHGILLAAHAFVPVAELYRRMSDAKAPESQGRAFRERFKQIVQKNSDALSVLTEHSEPTARGGHLIGDLDQLNAGHRAYLSMASSL